MPSTAEALAVLVVAILPGALYVWSFERVAGRWGIGLGDRALRFLGISAVLHVAAAPATYTLWHDYLRAGALKPDESLPLWLWPVAAAYVAVPVIVGTGLALALREGYDWAATVVGSNAAPTAWDAVFFDPPPEGWILMRLKSGDWVGGQWTDAGYVGGYPEPADIFLPVEAIVDQETEDFVRDDSGEPLKHDYGLLVRWDEIEYLEVSPTPETLTLAAPDG